MPDTSANTFLIPDLQVSFFHRLRELEGKCLHTALARAVSQVRIMDLDRDLLHFAGDGSLSLLARLGLRGESVFATPCLLRVAPRLIGYYRLLLGFSQKEFYGKSGFGGFKSIEESKSISKKQADRLDSLCMGLARSSQYFLETIGPIGLEDIRSLQLLTLGAQFRGTRNNELGQDATEKVFGVLKQMVGKRAISSSDKEISMRNAAGRVVRIRFASDPDIEVEEEFASELRGLISIEVKGGQDVSNIHNRIGEAEKSHQKAKQRGHREFMTIINVVADMEKLRQESPTTTYFFTLNEILDHSTTGYNRFENIFHSLLGI